MFDMPWIWGEAILPKAQFSHSPKGWWLPPSLLGCHGRVWGTESDYDTWYDMLRDSERPSLPRLFGSKCWMCDPQIVQIQWMRHRFSAQTGFSQCHHHVQTERIHSKWKLSAHQMVSKSLSAKPIKQLMLKDTNAARVYREVSFCVVFKKSAAEQCLAEVVSFWLPASWMQDLWWCFVFDLLFCECCV